MTGRADRLPTERMSANALLARLDRVRRVGDGRWIACCPAHHDRSRRSPSASCLTAVCC